MTPSPSIFPDQIACDQTSAAKLLGVCETTLRNWEKQGKISSTAPGGKTRLYLLDDLRMLARTGSAKRE